jgi:hypothetical protein
MRLDEIERDRALPCMAILRLASPSRRRGLPHFDVGVATTSPLVSRSARHAGRMTWQIPPPASFRTSCSEARRKSFLQMTLADVMLTARVGQKGIDAFGDGHCLWRGKGRGVDALSSPVGKTLGSYNIWIRQQATSRNAEVDRASALEAWWPL